MAYRSSSYKGSSRGYGEYDAPAAPSGNRWAQAAQAAEQSRYGNGASTGYRSWETVDEEPEDYDNGDWLQRKTKKVQNDSLMSTRRALQRLNETDTLAQSNMTKLHQQSGRNRFGLGNCLYLDCLHPPPLISFRTTLQSQQSPRVRRTACQSVGCESRPPQVPEQILLLAFFRWQKVQAARGSCKASHDRT